MPEDTGSPLLSARTLERLPPYSEEAERGVLGSILLDPERVLDLCHIAQLVEESFFVPAHRTVFGAVAGMPETKAVDVLTVSERLRAAGTLDRMGGASFLDRLIDATPTAAHAEYYIDIVRQKHLLRCVIDCAREAERACHESQDAADEILSRAEQAFLNITERQHGTITLWPDAIKRTMEHVEAVFNGSSAMGGISTGFRNLDKTALGLRPSEMIVLAARPSMGKTSLAMNIAENVSLGRGGRRSEGAPVAIFSLEMSQEALVLRMLCSHAEVSSHNLLAGRVSAGVHGRLAQAASALNKARIYVDDTGGLDVLELRARARRMQKKFDIGLIVVDYLQLLTSRESAAQGRQIEVSSISGNLKAMAKELKVPVLVLSQLSRAPEQRDKTGKPKLSDLRDSGAIEQDADMVWLLRRPCRYEGDERCDDKTLAVVDVAKQRNGPVGEVELNFEEDYTRFRDRAHGTDGIAEIEELGPGDGEEPII